MLTELLTHINEKGLLKAGDKVLLAVSGGKDSVVMLDLFSRLERYSLGVAHCNFQLRGRESDEDERLVETLAMTKGIPLHQKKFATKQFAKENHLSTQLAARQLRYEWFEEIRLQFGYDFIATAHHLNDAIETILLNLTKGTGLAGLHGIPEKNGAIIRPLLFASRAKIDAYIIGNKLEWREDETNNLNYYQRNLLRNEVIPLLKKINPNLEDTFARNIDRFSAAEAIVQQELEKLEVHEKEDGIIVVKINNRKSNIYLVELFLKKYNFNGFQAKEIFKSFSGQSGKTFHSSTHTLLKNREELIIFQKSLSPNVWINVEISLEKIEENEFKIELNQRNLQFRKISTLENLFPEQRNNSQLINFDKLVFPLKIRKWQQGDWFIPLGMKGKKKISDFLIDKKISLKDKENVFLLISGEEIVWVINHRLDERYKIEEDTANILEVSW